MEEQLSLGYQICMSLELVSQEITQTGEGLSIVLEEKRSAFTPFAVHLEEIRNHLH